MAIGLNPEEADYYNNLGSAQFELGLYEEAIESYKKAIELNPDEEDYYYMLGLAQDKLDLYEKAIVTGDVTEQLALFDQAEVIEEGEEGEDEEEEEGEDEEEGKHKKKIKTLVLKGKKDGFLTFEELINILPDFSLSRPEKIDETLMMLGQLRIDLIEGSEIKASKAAGASKMKLLAFLKERYKKLILEPRKEIEAIRINPDDVDAHYNLGCIYRNLGLHKEAIESYKQVIRIKPDFAKAQFAIGVVSVSLDDRSSALEQYKILKSLDSDLANKLFNLIYK